MSTNRSDNREPDDDPFPGDSRIDVGAEGQQKLRQAGGLLLDDHPAMLKRSGVLNIGRQRLRMSLVNEGAGRPLLLINGIGATGDLFDDFRVHLTDRETIAFDAPGVGGSPAPSWPWRIRWYARIIDELLGELGHQTVDVLGLSWGGALAQEFARRHPDRVRRLVLVATTPGVISLPGRPSALAVLMTPWRYYSPAYLKAVAPTLYGGAIRAHPEMMSRHSQVRSTRPPSPAGYVCQLGALRRWSSLPWLKNLPMPTLVMAGDDDPIIPVRNARMIANRIPDAELQVVEGGGHLFLFTRASEMAERIATFLDAE